MRLLRSLPDSRSFTGGFDRRHAAFIDRSGLSKSLYGKGIDPVHST
jgi:hypothetical protein